MITTVTLNPMLDKTVHVTALRRAAIVRATAMEMVVGGKGVNVSRQLHHLGVDTVATGFLGGEIGELLRRLLTAEGIKHDFVSIAAMTREGLTFLDAEGVQTSVFEPPAAPTMEEVVMLEERCRSLLRTSSWVVCSGSSPAPGADALYATIVRDARALGVRSLLDAYGAVFSLGVAAGPTVAKLNREEYQNTYHTAVRNEQDMVIALQRLCSPPTEWSIITDGARPWYACHHDVVWKVTPPPVSTVNTTGSGDSMVAGLLAAFTEGWDDERSLTFASSAGAANAARWGVAESSREDVLALFAAVQVEKINT
jgi:1-phosphofructokinase family hexose kinase